MHTIQDLAATSQIKLSSQVLLCTAQDQKNIMLVDPKTSGVLETYVPENAFGRRKIAVNERFEYFLGEFSEKTILTYFKYFNVKPALRASMPEKMISMTFSNDGLYFYGGAQSGLIYIWDALTGQMLHKIQAHHKGITKMLFNVDGSLLITVGEDYTMNVWTTASFFCRNTQWNRELSSVSLGEMVKVKPLQSLVGHTNFITDIALGQKKFGLLASSSIDKTCRIWNYQQGQLLCMISVESPVNCLCMDPLEEIIYMGCKNSNIYAHKLGTNQDIYQVLANEGSAENQDLKISVDKQTAKRKAYVGHKAEVLELQYFLQDNVLISGASDGQILFWNTQGEVMKKFSPFNKPITNLILLKRPSDFEKSDSFFKNRKKGIEPKVFKKYQDDKKIEEIISVPVCKYDEVCKKRHADEENNLEEFEQPPRKFIQLTYPLVEGSGIKINSTEQREVIAHQVELTVDDYKKEIDRLLALNQKLFNLSYLKDKI